MKSTAAPACCHTMILTSALILLWLPWPAESRQTMTSRTNATENSATTRETEQVRGVVRGALKNVDAGHWALLKEEFAGSVYVDYTSLFGGYPRDYIGDDLVDDWRQLLEPFSKTEHVLGPIVVKADETRARAVCAVRIDHILRGAPGGDEWVVIGQFEFTLEKRDGRWRIQGLVLDVQSQEGNSKLLVEAFTPADKRLPCEDCVAGQRAQQGQPASATAGD